MTFSTAKKLLITSIGTLSVFAITLTSSAYSGSALKIITEFSTSDEIFTLGISLFVLGFALGPALWAPLSELYGRRILFVTTHGFIVCFVAAAAGCSSMGQLLVFRFLAGVFGASPLTNSGGLIADLFPSSQRGVVPETYGPVLLRNTARRLSLETGKVHTSVLELNADGVDASKIFRKTLKRPWVLLFLEPIVLIASIYLSIVYGTIYMFMGAFPIVYQQERGETATPESRLPPGMLGAIGLPVGMFAFAWTNFPDVHWSVSIILSAPFGFGAVLIFMSCLNYLLDAYTIYAASVLAVSAMLRSLFGAAFPMFTAQMYANLGIHWASSVPASLTVAGLPFPFVMYKYGERLRMKCKYAQEAAVMIARMQTEAPGTATAKDEISV
ncbi:hypothetical protein IFR05_006440 [Cadophora sp. M221]|nr:hypothetical protein IFR05_006440 [Cadophora sp. M221]